MSLPDDYGFPWVPPQELRNPEPRGGHADPYNEDPYYPDPYAKL